MTIETADWLRARRACARAFTKVLGRLRSNTDVDERQFVDLWMRSVAETGELSRGGWYSPPPLGATVLSACPPKFERLSFSSLRDPAYFPAGNSLCWHNSVLFAYCSNVYLKSGTPGDYSVTLYFGDDTRIAEHFSNCVTASRQIVALATREPSSRNLFIEASELLGDFGLRNVIQSTTDPSILDLGHSLDGCGAVTANNDGTLPEATCQLISHSRRFINATADWDLHDGSAFTIEPQLVSTRLEALPKVCLHYTLGTNEGSFLVDDALEGLAERQIWQQR